MRAADHDRTTARSLVGAAGLALAVLAWPAIACLAQPASAATPAAGAGATVGQPGAALLPSVAGPDSRPAPPRPAELRRATERFLRRHGPSAGADAERSGGGGTSPLPPPPEGDQGERSEPLLPAHRVIAFYGAPQMRQTVIGLNSPRAATEKLAREMRGYRRAERRRGRRARSAARQAVVGAIDLVAVIATAAPGRDGKYRFRQDPRVIEAYLDRARAAGARLMLDIQPGRSSFAAEVRALRPWLRQPDVDLALDPEWNVGRRGVPGRSEGSAGAGEVNRIVAQLDRLVRRHDLPPKLLVVHQFHSDSVRHRRRLRERANVQTVLNFDGIGAPAAKRAGYARLAVPRLFNGFSIFYRRDRPLMSAADVLGLRPQPNFVLYQ